LWDPPGCSALVANTHRKVAEVGIWIKLLRMLCCQKDDQQQTVHSILACWWYQTSHVNKNVVTQVLISWVMNLERSSTNHNQRQKAPIFWFEDWSNQWKASADHYLRKQHTEWAALWYGWGGHHHVYSKSGSKNIKWENAEMFHHNVAKLLYLCKKAHPNIQTVVAFLTTRVKKPTKDDLK